MFSCPNDPFALFARRKPLWTARPRARRASSRRTTRTRRSPTQTTTWKKSPPCFRVSAKCQRTSRRGPAPWRCWLRWSTTACRPSSAPTPRTSGERCSKKASLPCASPRGNWRVLSIKIYKQTHTKHSKNARCGGTTRYKTTTSALNFSKTEKQSFFAL